VRPHSALHDQSPQAFATTWAPSAASQAPLASELHAGRRGAKCCGRNSRPRTAFRPALSRGEGRGRKAGIGRHLGRGRSGRFPRGSHLSYQSYQTAGKSGLNRITQPENSTSGWLGFTGQVTWSGVEIGGQAKMHLSGLLIRRHRALTKPSMCRDPAEPNFL
jgi:hypothetical protein